MFSAVLFLALLLITTGALYEPVSNIYTYLYENIPGGWAFRSPLKFQLFIPVILITLYALFLNSIQSLVGHVSKIAAITLTFGIILSSAHLGGQIYDKLLTPKQFASQPVKPN